MKNASKILLFFFMFAASAAISFFASVSVYLYISKQTDRLVFKPPDYCLAVLTSNRDVQKLFICLIAVIMLMGYLATANDKSDYRAKMHSVTPDLQIPERKGQLQHGSAWFMSDNKFNAKYPIVKLDLNKPIFKYLLREGKNDIREIRKVSIVNGEIKIKETWWDKRINKASDRYQMTDHYIKQNARLKSKMNTEPLKKTGGGLVTGYKRSGHKEYVNILLDDIHSLIIGSTGSGKTRYLVIQSIFCQLLAGESVFVSDIKGELYQYFCKVLKRLEINTIVLDYRDMSRSMSYNYLQPIIDKLAAGDVNKAIQLSRDYAGMIAGKKAESTDPMWHDGKVAVIAAAIIACTYDNMDKPQNQNLPYVYEWITRMCAERQGKTILLIDYLQVVGEDHPANLLLAQANVAPSKTRGSFYTAACTALAVFTDRQLYHICSSSDFKLTDLVTKKTAMFVILPESKTTFYPLVSLMVSQIYEALDDYSNVILGSGRLPRRLHFDLDEFGNFSAFPDFNMMLTVGRSKGIIFNLFLQSYAQLKVIYDDKVSEIIKGNCTNQIYLKSTDDEGTNKAISNSLDSYTTSSYSLSSNTSKYGGGGSTSMNLSERKLLYPSELKQIERPYMLVMSDTKCKVKYCPDLSKWAFNTMLGLGNKKHNEKVRAIRQRQRPILKDVNKPPEYVGIWKNFNAFKIATLRKQNRI